MCFNLCLDVFVLRLAVNIWTSSFLRKETFTDNLVKYLIFKYKCVSLSLGYFAVCVYGK